MSIHDRATADTGLVSRVQPWLVVLLYVPAWVALEAVSRGLWYLPAGLRLAMLWWLPRRRWPWLAAADWLAAALAWQGNPNPPAPLALTLAIVLPWTAYALAVRLLHPGPAARVPDSPIRMLRLLAAGLFGAGLTGPALMYLIGSGQTHYDNPLGSLGFLSGDLLGQLTLTPLLLSGLLRPSREAMRALLRDIVWVLLPALAVLLLLLEFRPIAGFGYLLGFVPLMYLAFAHGWAGVAWSLPLSMLALESATRLSPQSMHPPLVGVVLAVAGAGVLLLGAAMDALRLSHWLLADRNRELARANAALAETQYLLNQGEQQAEIGTWSWALDGDRVWWSRGVYLLLGLDPAGPPTPWSEHDRLYTQESYLRLRHAIELAVAQGVGYELELEAVRPSGEHRRCIAAGRAIRGPHGTVVRLIGILRDVTDERRLRADLEQRGRELQAMARRLTRLQEQGQRELAAELHDELGQAITALATKLSLALRAAPDSETRTRLETLREQCARIHDSLRRALQHLRPAVLDSYGLRRALTEGPPAELLADAGIEFRPAFDGQVDALDEDHTTALYRICQEAVTNCVRHARARRFSLDLEVAELPSGLRRVRLTLTDDGIGGAAEQGETGQGLAGIRSRVLALDGAYRFASGEGGTSHRVEFLLPP